ncbi:hypothetical protein HYV84_08400 [Candidatus Woesearchaeota archaeon]|nr:hypothetical protein [Candidatus Woesearchaeota archaeon]
MRQKPALHFFSTALGPGILHTPRAWAGFFLLAGFIASLVIPLAFSQTPPYDSTKPSHDILYTDTIDAKTAAQIEIAKSANIIGDTKISGKLGVNVPSIAVGATVDVNGNVKAAGFTLGATTITDFRRVGSFIREDNNVVHYDDGNVGIGTASPATKLDVIGGAAFQGNNLYIRNPSSPPNAQTWGMVVSTASGKFNIGQATDAIPSSGSLTTSPFSIQPGAPSGTLFIGSDGIVTIGQGNSQSFIVQGQSQFSRSTQAPFESDQIPDATIILRESSDTGGKQASIGFLNNNVEGLIRFAAGPNSGAGITGELGLSAVRFIFGSPVPNVKASGEFTGDLFVGGNLGIGTTTPKTRFHFSGNTQSPPFILLTSEQAPANSRTLGIRSALDNGNFEIVRMNDVGDTLKRTDFAIDAVNGNVGIGTTSPSQRLTIVQGADDFGNGLRVESASAVADLSGSLAGVRLSSTKDLLLGSGGNTQVTIKENGNVGIGTTTPAANAKLDVAGTVRATAFEGTFTGIASVPSGAVIFYDGTSCPAGWSRLSGSQGRVIVGLTDNAEDPDVKATVGAALSNKGKKTITEVPAHTHSVNPPSTASSSSGAHTHDYQTWKGDARYDIEGDGGHAVSYSADSRTTTSAGAHTHTVDIASFTSGSTGASSVDVTMPYIQLLVCKKD